jgi:hypothetical protein
MNTPAHAVLNLVALGRDRSRFHWLPVLLGSLVPDLPLFVFYLAARGILQLPERTIWSATYFEPSWQLFFDIFNSLPLIALGILLAWRFRSTGWMAFFLSMGLHCLTDLLVHHDDAHRHFLPFSDWRFVSPVSYWDPRHHGHLFLVAEAVLVAVGSGILMRRSEPRAVRWLGGVTLALYLLGGAWALYAWGVPGSSLGRLERRPGPLVFSAAEPPRVVCSANPAPPGRVDRGEQPAWRQTPNLPLGGAGCGLNEARGRSA